MSATVLTLTIEPGALDARSSWTEFESLAVQMSREVPLRALEDTLADAQERLIDSVCGPRWSPVRGLAAPFACPRCEMAEDFARKGKRTRRRKLHTAAGTVELVLWNVGCRGCGRVFAPLLIMLGLSGKRRTDRLTVNLAELGTQVSFARAAGLSRELAGTTATAGQAHNALADTAALLSGADGTLGPVNLIDRLPRLANAMDDDVMPLLDRLDQSGPDLNQLLDSVSDLNRMAGRLPKVFRRRT